MSASDMLTEDCWYVDGFDGLFPAGWYDVCAKHAPWTGELSCEPKANAKVLEAAGSVATLRHWLCLSAAQFWQGEGMTVAEAPICSEQPIRVEGDVQVYRVTGLVSVPAGWVGSPRRAAHDGRLL